MELKTSDSSGDGFAVTLDWPVLSNAETVGHGTRVEDHLAWSEDHLVRGERIVLGGRYKAALVDPNTLVGVYENGSQTMGFFTLSRVKPVTLAMATMSPVRFASR
jgi:hypothetical protein